ncbi:MAG: hypothetical protein Fur0042_20130 [Cyanophyceae cyanobacterium]
MFQSPAKLRKVDSAPPPAASAAAVISTDSIRSAARSRLLRPGIWLRAAVFGAIATVSVGFLAPVDTSEQQSLSEKGLNPVPVEGFNPMGANSSGANPSESPDTVPGTSLQSSLLNGGEKEHRDRAAAPHPPATGSKAAAGGTATSAPARPSVPPPPANPEQEKSFWMANAPGQSQKFDLRQSLRVYGQLYQSPTSLGVVAVGMAEGNYTMLIQNGSLFVQPTGNYYGHTDPGNLSWGERVTNYGPCSDQGRSRGNIALAEKMCVDRLRDRLPTLLTDLNAAGIDPYGDLPALLNAADLYNQASPIHSRWFPHALAIAKRGGLYGPTAYAWARTASFYLDENDRLNVEKGTNRASGLLGICAREGRAATQWDCVYADQARRVNAIAQVYDKFLQLATR